MTIPFVSTLRKIWPHQPRVVGGLVAAGFLLWSTYIGYTYFISTPPSESDIASQSVKINAAKLQAVNDHLTTYRLSPELPSVQPDLFSPTQP